MIASIVERLKQSTASKGLRRGSSVLSSAHLRRFWLSAVLLFSALGWGNMALAETLFGKIYLDFDNSGSATSIALDGITVELVSTGETVTSDAQGNFSFTVNSGNHTLRAFTAQGEEVSGNYLVPPNGNIQANLFLKGLGGDLRITSSLVTGSAQENRAPVANIPFTFDYGANSLDLGSNASGEALIQNTLLGVNYSVSVDPNLLVEMTNYALWDMTDPTGANAHTIQYTGSMTGSAQTLSLNLRERNSWGFDGNANMTYTDNRPQTAAEGVELQLLYSGTETQVLGQTPIVIGSDGRYHFENLAVGSYQVKVTRMPDAVSVVSPGALASVNLLIPNGNLQGPDFAFRKTVVVLPYIQGTVFIVGPSRAPSDGYDGGGNRVNIPVSGDIGVSTDVELYQHVEGQWQLYDTVTSNASNYGRYTFYDVATGFDYKIKVLENGIDTANNVFGNDFDGKSSSTDPTSRSRLKGRVSLLDGTREVVAGKEIVVRNITSNVINMSFWYAPKIDSALNLTGRIKVVADGTQGSANTSINGVAAIDAGAPIRVRFFEEDGLTPIIFEGETEQRVYENLLWDNGSIGPLEDNALPAMVPAPGAYVINVETKTDAGYALVASAIGAVRLSTQGASVTSYVRATGLGSIAGQVYLNGSHVGQMGSYNPGAGDIALYSVPVTLQQQQSDGSWANVGQYGTNAQGEYSFVNLPPANYRVRVAATGFGASANVSEAMVALEGNNNGLFSSAPTHSEIDIRISTNGENLTDYNHFFSLADPTASEPRIEGTIYLDSLGNNAIDAYDRALYGASVLLCSDNTDCRIGGSSVLSEKVTTVNGQYGFTSADGLTQGTTYTLKVEKAGTSAYVDASLNLAGEHSVAIAPSLVQITHEIDFLMKGDANGIVSFYTYIDLNGNDVKDTGDNGRVVPMVQYRDDNGNWQDWGTLTYTSNNTQGHATMRNMPAGNYRFIGETQRGNASLVIGDSDLSTPLGIAEFTVTSDGTVTPPNASFTEIFKSSSTGAAGYIYLDLSGTGVYNANTVQRLPSDYLQNVSVRGYFMPSLSTLYNTTEDVATRWNSPEFVDTAIAAQGGIFYQLATNSSTGSVYLTSMLLKVDGLDNSLFEIVSNNGSATKGATLPQNVIDDPAYMGVQGNSGSNYHNRHWLLRLKNPNEISGTLFYDLDGDDAFSDGIDPPMTGVTVQLYKDGTLLRSMVSSASGEYKFVGLFDGTYSVRVTNTGLDTDNYTLLSPALGSYDDLAIDISQALTYNNLNFSYRRSTVAEISGTIALDLNNSGALELSNNKQGDLVLSNIPLELYLNDTTGTPVATTTSNSRGFFRFGNISTKNTHIIKVLEIDYGALAAQADHPSAQVDAVNQISIDIQSGDSFGDNAFLMAGSSNTAPNTGANSSAANGSGIQGQALSSGTPVAGVVVSLLDASGNEIARTVSDANGVYQFYNLPAGTYSVSVYSSPDGFALGNINRFDDIIVGNAGVSTGDFPYSAASPNGIQGRVWLDLANDNTSVTNDANDLPWGGVSIELFDNLTATGTPVLSTTSQADGSYAFPNLLYGNDKDYSVRIRLDGSSDYAPKLDKDGASGVIAIAQLGELGSSDNHFIILGLDQIDGDVRVAASANNTSSSDIFIDGVTVSLNAKAVGESTYRPIATSTSANGGVYRFANAAKGVSYQLLVDSSAAALEGTSVLVDMALPNNSDSYAFTFSGSETFSTAYGYLGVASGRVYLDLEGDGQVGGIKLLDSTVISLSSSNSLISIDATTDLQGNFTINKLPVDNWSVAIKTLPTGYQFSYGLDSSANVVTTPPRINISDANPSPNAVELAYKGSSSIAGRVVLDIDPSDGDALGANDIAAQGVRVSLRSATSGFVAQSTLSDAQGNYRFDDLSTHSYDIEVDTSSAALAGYVASFPSSALQNVQTVNLPSMSTEQANIDFGYKGSASLSGVISRDVAGRGIRFAELERAQAGITLKATQGNVVRYSNASYANGEFTIDNLSAGLWTITLDERTLPSDLSFSYTFDALGATATAVEQGIEINIDPAAARSGVSEAQVSFALKASASIAGTLSIDINGDDGASFAANDILLSDVFSGYEVVLKSGATELGRSRVQGDGSYRFENLSESVPYTLELAAPSNDYQSSYIAPSSSAGVNVGVSDLQASVMTQSYSLNATNTEARGSDFAFKGKAVLAGSVRIDVADDNTSIAFDGSDIALENVALELYRDNTRLKTTTSDASGAYAFNDLALVAGGTYELRALTPSDAELKFSKNASNPNIVISTTQGSNDNDYLFVGKQVLNGEVWIDANANLSLDSDEGVNNLNIALNVKLPGSSSYQSLKNQVTNKGEYAFSRLAKGLDYQIIIDSNAAALAGTRLLVDATLPNNRDTLEVFALSNDARFSTAYGYEGVISGRVLIDLEGDQLVGAVQPLAGVVLTIRSADGSIVREQTSDTSGNFSQSNLPIGQWLISAKSVPTNYALSYAQDGSGALSSLPLSVSISAANATPDSVNIAYHGSASASGRVVLDIDPSDGDSLSANDTGVAGVGVSLISAETGFVTRTTTTANDGSYRFDKLSVHNYSVSVDSSAAALNGYIASFPSVAVNNSLPANVGALNGNVASLDFGYKGSGALSGIIYRDIAGTNQRFNALERTQAGVRVKATQGAVVRYSNVTLANGVFTISELPVGLWTVTLDESTLPSDLRFSYSGDAVGATSTAVSNGIEVEIDPAAATRDGVKGASVNFALHAAAAIEGRVMLDVNTSSGPNIGAEDIPVNGRDTNAQVVLMQGATELARQTLQIDGSYRFENLSEAVEYTVLAPAPSVDYAASFIVASNSAGVSVGTNDVQVQQMSQNYTLGASNTQASNSDFVWKSNTIVSGGVRVDLANDNRSIDFDANDIVLANMTLELHKDGSLLTTTTTDANGDYIFSELALAAGGSYVVKLRVPSDYTLKLGKDGVTQDIAITGTTSSIGNDYILIGKQQIAGQVWLDHSGDKVAEANELIDGVNLVLKATLAGSEVDIASATTGADGSLGSYRFSNIAKDVDYRVLIDGTSRALAGSVLTPTADIANNTDSHVLRALAGDVSNLSTVYNYTGSMNGQLKLDVDANQTRSAVDSTLALGGITLQLINLDNSALNRSLTSDANGAFVANKLASGNWQLSIDNQQSGLANYGFSYSVDAANQVSNKAQLAVTLVDNANIDFAYYGVASLRGRVVIDSNVDDGAALNANDIGLEGIRVMFDASEQGFAARSTQTDTDGYYQFDNLSAYEYRVSIQSNSPALQGYALSFAPPNALESRVSVSSDGVNRISNLDFGYKGSSSISGVIYRDALGMGAHHAVNAPLAGVKVKLTQGDVVRYSEPSDANGRYSVSDLPSGLWVITLDESSLNSEQGFSYSANTFGATDRVVNEGVELELNPAAETRAGVKGAVADFGVKGSAQIAGRVVIDSDTTSGDVIDAGDAGLAAVPLSLSVSNPAGETHSVSVQTDSEGNYAFNSLSQGSYMLSLGEDAAPLNDYRLSFSPAGSGNQASSSMPFNLSGDNEAQLAQDFGLDGNNYLEGYIRRDISGSANTSAEAQGEGIAGIVVSATQNGALRLSRASEANGRFVLEGLTPGNWNITLERASIPTGLDISYIADGQGNVGTLEEGLSISVGNTRAQVQLAIEITVGMKAQASLGGRVMYRDNSANEVPLSQVEPNYRIRLLTGSKELATQTLAADGSYAFDGLSAGVAYTVEALSPAEGYAFASNTPIASGVSASDKLESNARMANTYVLNSDSALARGETFVWQGNVSLSGDIFFDRNDNGSFDAGSESGVGSALNVSLRHKAGVVAPLSQTVAANATRFRFSGLMPGEWTLSVNGVTRDYVASFDADDNFDANNLATSPNEASLSLSSGDTRANFGYIQGGAMQGVVRLDDTMEQSYNENHRAIEGVSVALQELNGTAVASTTTDAEGLFGFRNLSTRRDMQVMLELEPDATRNHPLAGMIPSYDSQGMKGVDLSANRHVLLAPVSSVAGNKLKPSELHFGYRSSLAEISVSKRALKDNVVVGDLVPYRIRIENLSNAPALRLSLQDVLPAGFKLVNDSVRLDGEIFTDVSGSATLIFNNLELAGGEVRTLNYLLVVGAGVTQGEYINTAQMRDISQQIVSNESQASVSVTADSLFEDALIFGKVYIDSNGNGMQDEGEQGLAGVKLITARGEIITTDGLGRYHLAGVDGGRWERGGNFVIKLDLNSLPKDLVLKDRNPKVVRVAPGLPEQVDFKLQAK